MVSSAQLPVHHPALRPGQWSRTALRLSALFLLSACAAQAPLPARQVSELAPLRLDDRQLEVAAVETRVTSPDLLALDQPMKDFVHRYTRDVSRDRARLMTLHRAVKGVATLGVRYDPDADGTAREAFHRGSANCLSYASLFVALAREAGLDAGYQWLEVNPAWMRDGERVAVRLHVNVLVQTGRNEQFMADIDPLAPGDIAGTRLISDTDALALYHSNIGVDALGAGQVGEAWLQSVRALQLSPGMAHLWVNLGAIYRANKQHRDAEQAYLYALQLDPEEYSAMNNLAVLYEVEGRAGERAYWEQQLAGYRDANPYYHTWLGDEAAESGEWREAVRSYERALALSPGDSRLLYALGSGYQHLGEPREAIGYLQRAIASAPSRADSASYEQQLEALRGSTD